MTTLLITSCLISYVIGSIPFALIISRLKGVDLRNKGSKNLGATNVLRVMGWPYGLTILLLDMSKGFIPTYLAINYIQDPLFHILIGTCCIIGHSFTPFVKFKGGKGAATGLGVLLSLSPPVWLITVCVFIALIIATRIVSIGTMAGCIVTPFAMWYMQKPMEYVIFVGSLGAFIIWRHKENIKRLIQGKENKL